MKTIDTGRGSGVNGAWVPGDPIPKSKAYDLFAGIGINVVPATGVAPITDAEHTFAMPKPEPPLSGSPNSGVLKK